MLKRFGILGILVLMGGGIVILFLQLNRIGKAIPLIQQTVDQTDERMMLMQRAVVQMSDDLNETRNALGLPQSRYQVWEDADEEEGGDSLYFRAVEKLLQTIDEQKATDAMQALQQHPSFQQQLRQFAVQAIADAPVRVRLEQEERPIAVILAKADAGYQMTAENDLLVESDSLEGFIIELSEVLPQLDQQMQQRLRRERGLQDFLSQPSVLASLEEKGLTIGNTIVTDEGIDVPILLGGETVDRVQFDSTAGWYRFQDQQFDTFAEFRTAFPELLEAGTFMHSEERIRQEAADQLRAALQDPAFQEYLRLRELKVSFAERRDDEHLFFDILSLVTEKRVGSFALHYANLQLWLFDADGVPISSLQTLLISDAETPPTLPVMPQIPDSTVFLISGLREQLTDTMIMAIANTRTQTLQFVSIPRDLFYRDRKINQLYLRYGSQRFIRELEQITGIAIQHHVFIDMYAFIEVIDILGGIDVTLHEPLIDPTYRVKTGTIWSTLYYPAGDYHFNGLEALRVVRSRHTTDDFDRASRQQRILLAIQNELSKLRVSDVKKLYQLLSIMSKYVTTDLNPFQIISYLVAYENLEIQPQKVLSTDNVLYTTYSNLYYTGKTLNEVDPETFDKGAWILLPRDGDWSRIHGFFKEVVKG